MTVLYLLFKAHQPGLFDQQVQVTGHVTKRGTVVAPYSSTRKKRQETPPAPDLFAEADRKAMEADQKKAQEEAARQERQEREAEAAKKAKPTVSPDELERVELLSEFNGKWRYRMRPGGNWYHANSKEGAIEGAATAYQNANPDDLITPEELNSRADKTRFDDLDNRFRSLSDAEIERRITEEKAAANSLRTDPGQEIKNGRRSTGAATRNEGARDAAQMARDLEFYLSERKAKEEAEAAKKAKPAKKESEDDSDDPNSPNYRFRDTGYIAGSRKEDAARFIRTAGRDGRRLNPTDIDWEQIEKNPREAKELITKSNLFGSVDWETLKAGGMEPGAGFLLDRVYASIGKEPSEDSPEARKYYALGLQSARDRLETCKTAKDITAALLDMQQELDGTMLTAEQAEAIRPIEEAAHAAFKVAREAEEKIDEKWKFAYAIENKLQFKKYDQQKRANRKWKPDPDLDREIAELTAAKDAAYKEWSDYKDAHPEADRRLGSDTPLTKTARALYDRAKQMRAEYKAKNTLDNPLFRAWLTLGERFVNVLRHRAYKGSDSFKDHVAAVLAGKITDWSWAEKEGKTAAPGVTKREKAFALKVIDQYERKGGRSITIDSTAALKKEFGLRDVQSGNWVLDDPTSAKWHVQQAAEAFADLADLCVVPDELVSMKGRLALAFGARGKGNAGFGGAARAHYEPVQRVINITKMGGGGCLAHEWFHCLDNLIGEMESGKPTGKEDWATESTHTLPAELGAAMRELGTAMTEGTHRHSTEYTYTGHDVKTAALNMRPRPGDYGTPTPVKIIRDAGNVHDAVQRLQEHFAKSAGDRKAKKREAEWTTIAVAHYGADPNGGTLKVKAGPARSKFAHEAVRLDEGTAGKYWSQRKEMAARAFQSYVEDKMAAMGRQSDYLSAWADNKYYRDPLFGDQYPFPEGEERTRINAAFDKLLAAMKQHRTLEKALLLLNARYLFLKAA